MLEQVQSWWSGTGWFRCETCRWRGRLRDVWDSDAAFPHLPPLRLGRELDMEFLQQRDEESLIELVMSRQDELKGILKVWLDDSRAAPPGWLRVTTVEGAKKLLGAGLAEEISLDYDLGWCAECLGRGDHLKRSGQRHCPHMATGYDLVVWMAETGFWSHLPPIVHSGNMEGGAKMLGVIAKQWRGPGRNGPAPEAPAAPQTEPGKAAPARAAAGEEPRVSRGGLDSSTVTTLSTCQKCGRAGLYRAHRHSNLQRIVSMIMRRYPVRCEACGWMQWSKAPILVRLSPGADASAERIETDRIDQMDRD